MIGAAPAGAPPRWPGRRLPFVIAARIAVGAVAMTPAPAAAQDDTAALRREIAALRQRLDELERRLAGGAAPAAAAPEAPSPIAASDRGAPASGQTVMRPAALAAAPTSDRDDRHQDLELGALPLDPGTPSYWRVPGTATQVRFGGYIRLGAYKDLVDNLDGFKFRAGNIHPSGDPRRRQTGNIQAQMRLTRISFDTRTPTRLGELRTVLAMDFAGSEPRSYQAEAVQNNGYHLRLAHAYAELGPFPVGGIASEVLIGQTWSNFLDDPDTAESIDPSGPAGVPSERQPQLRYTARFGGHALSVSAENPIGEYQLPGTAAASSVYNANTTNRWPDVTAKYEVEQDWGRAQLSGVLRSFDVDDGLGHRAAATGYGVIGGGTLNLGAGDRLGGQVWFGDGTGKYIPDEFANPNGFAVDGYGTARVVATTQRSYGGSLWIRHYWAPAWRSTLAIGHSGNRYADFVIPAPDQATALDTALANLIYAPLPMLDLGVELEYGQKCFRKTLALTPADALRLSFSSRVKFN